MLARRTLTVYGLLALGWGLLATWQILEHDRFQDTADKALRNRARDISNTLGVVIRSQRFFITQSQVENVLQELVTAEKVISIALLNSAGEIVASGGVPLDIDVEKLPRSGMQWRKNGLAVVNLIDLGEEEPDGQEKRPAAVVVPAPEPFGPPDGNRSGPADRGNPPPPPGPPPGWPGGEVTPATPNARPFWWNTGRIPSASMVVSGTSNTRYPPSAYRRSGEVPSASFMARVIRGSGRIPSASMVVSGTPYMRAFSGPSRRWHRFDRPFWMNEEEYKSLLEKKGLCGFVLVMSTEAFHASIRQDLWLRMALTGIALVAVGGLGLAWRNMERSAGLRLRLIRASEMNLHLKEMNIAAAGLAHETRNPLNIVRGLSQLIASQAEASEEIRRQAKDIAEEVDRATARLNEFIEYSKPPEAKPAPTPLNAVIREVDRTLAGDKDEKAIQVEMTGQELTVDADERLLRQVIFNLLLNAVQEVPREGRIEIAVMETASNEASFEIRDNGPGVPAESREIIFRPYYTTHETGTGLGLAVVRQIVLAHGWEVEYIPREGGGSIFRVSGLKISSGNS